MSYYYFFKNNKGKELSFYFNPQENTMNSKYDFLGNDLMVNKSLVGKKFRITYKLEKRNDDYTGNLTTFNIPTKIERIEK
jgi:hypothetical protein